MLFVPNSCSKEMIVISVCSPEFKMGSFFTQYTMECVRHVIAGARIFLTSASDFDPRSCLCVSDRSAFIQRHLHLYEAHLARRKEESYQRFLAANQRVRIGGSSGGRDDAFSVSSCSRPAHGGSAAVRGSKSSAKRSSQQAPKSVSYVVSSVKMRSKSPRSAPVVLQVFENDKLSVIVLDFVIDLMLFICNPLFDSSLCW